MMPVLDGYSVLEMLRKEEATARIPIVLTAVTLERVRRKCLAEGATHVLTKPFSDHDLSGTIAEALGDALQISGAERPLQSYAAESAPR